MLLIRGRCYFSEIQKVSKLNLRTKRVIWHAQISLILILLWVGVHGPKTDCCGKAVKCGICGGGKKKSLLSQQKHQRNCSLGRSEDILWGPPLKGTARYWDNLPSLIQKAESRSVQLLIFLSCLEVGQNWFLGDP